MLILIVVLLVVIAVGVLLISESGTILLGFGLRVVMYVALFLILVAGILVIYIFDTENKPQAELTKNAQSTDFSQKPETADDPFDFSEDWYYSHDVSNASRCYVGGTCSPSDWAFAVYGDQNDKRGQNIYELALKKEQQYKALFPKGLCVDEDYDRESSPAIKICELGYSDEISKNPPYVTLAIPGDRRYKSEFICIADNRMYTYSNIVGPLILDAKNNYQFCVSNAGNISIRKDVYVNKFYNSISLNEGTSVREENFVLPKTYRSCIWTSYSGTGVFPYIEAAGSVKKDWHAGHYYVRAFCYNDSKEVDIYTR